MEEQKMIDFCRDQLAAYKVLKMVEFISEIPHTQIGKSDRKALRAMEQARLKSRRCNSNKIDQI